MKYYEEVKKNGAYWEPNVIETDNEYLLGVKDNKSKIENIVNKISRDLYKNYNEESTWNNDSIFEEDFKEFMEGEAPIVNEFVLNCDYVEMHLLYTSGWEESQLFYQDDLIKKVNESGELAELGYILTGQDYLAIYIEPIM